MITQCEFGSMNVDGKVYRSDLIIFPDGRVADNWWRASGHRFSRMDLEDLLAAGPEVIVAGTGIHGMVRLTSDLKEELARQGIELVAEPTKPAAQSFNRLIRTSRKVAGCFHLTC